MGLSNKIMREVKLCWLKNGVVNKVTFNSIEELQRTMSVHLPNGEWVEDMDSNKLDIEIQYAN